MPAVDTNMAESSAGRAGKTDKGSPWGNAIPRAKKPRKGYTADHSVEDSDDEEMGKVLIKQVSMLSQAVREILAMLISVLLKSLNFICQ